jgi:imidazolonepropionase-like amidohydrolase
MDTGQVVRHRDRLRRHANAVVIGAAGIVLFTGCARAPRASTAERTESFAVENVTVVDPESALADLSNVTVLVERGRITAVGPANSVAVPRGASRIDGAGLFIVPGLWDMHVHFMNAGRNALAQYVAYGITTVREMGGYLDSTRAWQRDMRAGRQIGPRLLTPGGMLESQRYLDGVVERSARAGGLLAPRILPYRVGVTSASDARRVIDSIAVLRVDFVKYRTVGSAEALFAILREARVKRLMVAGHRPGVASVEVAADSGQTDFEHSLGISDTSERTRVARTFARRGTWWTPTLAVARAVAIPGDSAFQLVRGPDALNLSVDRAAAAPFLLSWWDMQIAERRADTTGASRRAALRDFEETQKDVAVFAREGVNILAGTDAGSVLVYPGVSLHDELALLVGAGMSPRQALAAATTKPAAFFTLSDSLGFVRPGYVADFLLLDSNPVMDIRATRRIRMVVQSGRIAFRAIRAPDR